MRNFDYGNHEGRMIRRKTHQLERQSKMLRHLVTNSDNLPDWINRKVNIASDYLNSAAQYMSNRVSTGDYDIIHSKKSRKSTKTRKSNKSNKNKKRSNKTSKRSRR